MSFKDCFQEDRQFCEVLCEAGETQSVVARGLGARQSDVSGAWGATPSLYPGWSGPPVELWPLSLGHVVGGKMVVIWANDLI